MNFGELICQFEECTLLPFLSVYFLGSVKRWGFCRLYIDFFFQEKDDLEARFNEINMKLEQTSSQQALVQQEHERSRQQASEALKSMDVERQQLRTANSK